MNRWLKISLNILFWFTLFWALTTFFVQRPGDEKYFELGLENTGLNALLVYDPDPFYNLDEQVCLSFAEGLVENNWRTQIASVKTAKNLDHPFDMYVFCTNTYNWAPDKAVSDYIQSHEFLENKSVVAIALGSDSTQTAHCLIEDLLLEKKAKVLISRSLWLIHPNDENKLNMSNVEVAIDMAKCMALEIAEP